MAGPLGVVQSGLKSDYDLQGPIAGLVAAQQLADQQAAQGRNFRNNDLEYETDLNKYNNQILDNPLVAAKRQEGLLDTQENIGMHESGDLLAQKKAINEAKISEAMAAKTSGQLKDAENRMELVSQAYRSMEDENESPLAGHRNAEYYKNSVLPRAKLLGLEGKLPPQWGPEAKAVLAKQNDAAINNLPTLRKIAEEKQKHQDAMALHAQSDEAAQKRAETVAASGMARSEAGMAEEKVIRAGMDKKGGYDESDVARLGAVYDREIEPKDRLQMGSVKTSAETYFATHSQAEKVNLNKGVKLPPEATPAQYAEKVYQDQVEENKKKYLSGFLAGKKYLGEGSPTTAVKAVVKSSSSAAPKIGDTKVVNGESYTYKPKTTATPEPAAPVMGSELQGGMVGP